MQVTTDTTQGADAGARYRAEPDWFAAIADAVRAPSSHNSQPWRFRLISKGVQLHADFRRRLPVVDPYDRELFISCGAALEQLRLALAAQGFGCSVTLDDGPGSLVATVCGGARETAHQRDLILYQAIEQRQTTRRAFDMMPLPAEVVDNMARAASRRDTLLHLVTDVAEQRWLVELIMEADEYQSNSPAFRDELAAWLRPNDADATDGMTGSAVGLGDFSAYAAPYVMRTFDMGGRQAARDEQLLQASALVAILATPLEGKHDWIRCGQALAGVALTAAAAGFTMSYLNQPVEVPKLRDELRDLLSGHFYPQLVMRFGRAERGPPSARRPVADVIDD